MTLLYLEPAGKFFSSTVSEIANISTLRNRILVVSTGKQLFSKNDTEIQFSWEPATY